MFSARLDDCAQPEQTARAAAFADARRKADAIAALAGVSIDGVATVNENGGCPATVDPSYAGQGQSTSARSRRRSSCTSTSRSRSRRAPRRRAAARCDRRDVIGAPRADRPRAVRDRRARADRREADGRPARVGQRCFIALGRRRSIWCRSAVAAESMRSPPQIADTSRRLSRSRFRSSRWAHGSRCGACAPLAGPPWFVLLFFVPVVNLAFFAALCVGAAADCCRVRMQRDGATRVWQPLVAVVGSRRRARRSTRDGARRNGVRRVRHARARGVRLGRVRRAAFRARSSRCVVGRREIGPRTAALPSRSGIALASIAVTAGLLVAFAFEGIVCLALAAPLAVPLAIFGGLAGRAILTMPRRRAAALVAGAGVDADRVFGCGAVAGARRAALRRRVARDRGCATRARVAARHRVRAARRRRRNWRSGRGSRTRCARTSTAPARGAIRYCEFSTGAFVEPITAWDAPRRLAFSVAQNPPPMRELSPWGAIDAPHLAHFLVADAGRVPPQPAARRPHGAGRHDVVSPPSVSRRLLALVVGCDHPPHPSARARARRAVEHGRSRERRRGRRLRRAACTARAARAARRRRRVRAVRRRLRRGQAARALQRHEELLGRARRRRAARRLARRRRAGRADVARLVRRREGARAAARSLAAHQRDRIRRLGQRRAVVRQPRPPSS